MTPPDQLTQSYMTAIGTDSYTVHAKFIEELVASNDPQRLNFHYSLLKQSLPNLDLYRRLCAAFEKRGNEGVTFLMNKLQNEPDVALKGDVIQIIGKMRRPEIIPIARSYLKSDERLLRYKSIIVLGWNGSKPELDDLDERLLNEPDNELRSFAATAMRQIWYQHKELKNDILGRYLVALERENDKLVNASILSCLQDMVLKKFGIKETQYGDISGDVEKAKPKAVKFIRAYLTQE